MKQYTFDDPKETFSADLDGLRQRLAKEQRLLANYEELAIEQADDDAYVARGNGFCDSKFSPEFIDDQIERINHRITQLQAWIDGTEL